jgi:hypothetical protein
MTKPGWFERFGTLAGPLFTILIVVGFVVGGSTPDPDAPTPKITRYLASKSDYHKNVASFFIVLAAALLLIAFYAALRSRLIEAEGGQGRLAALALAAGAVSTALFTSGIWLFGIASIAAHDAAKHGAILDPGIYRLTQDLGYQLWVGFSALGAIVAWCTWGVARRTGAIAGWFGWVSLVVGVACLASLFFFPILLYSLWIAVAGIVLLRRPATTGAPSAGAT